MSRLYYPSPLPSVALIATALAALACSASSDKGASAPLLAPVSVQIDDPSADLAIPLASLVDGSDYPLRYSVTNFTIAAHGECAGKPAPCGHGRIWVDGMACNDMTRSLDYNAEGPSPVDVGFDYCATMIGPHDILLELHNDDGSPFTDPATGGLVSDTVHVSVTGATTASAGGGAGGAAGGSAGGAGGQAGAP